jgi:ribose transport system substrate-binding protein
VSRRHPNRTRQRLILSMMLISVLLLLVSCTNNHTGQPEIGRNISSPSNDKESRVQPPASYSHTFAIIYPMPHSLYEMITQKAEETAKKLGVRLIVGAPDEANLEQQIRMMENLIKQGVDGIAIDPIDPVTLTPVINKAVKAGIKVICFESDAPESDRLAYIGSDNIMSGRLMGEYLDKLLKGKGMVLIETGMSEMLPMRQRLEGLLNYLNEETRIQVLDVQYNEGLDQKALSDMELMIDDHPHFDALATLDIISSSNAILLWKAKGLNRSALTFGMTPEIQQALHNGQIAAAVSQREYEWGHRIVELLLDAQNGPVASFHDSGTIVYEKGDATEALQLD